MSKEALVSPIFRCNYFKADRDNLRHVAEINDYILDTKLCRKHIYENKENFYVPFDLLHSVEIASLPPRELRQKIGMVVMLIRNLDDDMGQCKAWGHPCRNAAHIVLKTQAQDTLLAKPVTRFQFLVKLTFTMTINKSQEQTFGRIGIYLEKSVWATSEAVPFHTTPENSSTEQVHRKESLVGKISFSLSARKLETDLAFQTISSGISILLCELC